MKFKSSAFSQTSGSIGGTTFSHNRGGLYTRTRTIPTDPITARQVLMRSSFGTLANVWSSVLTPAQREIWELYAASVTVLNVFGDSINLTGQQMYIRCNTPRLQAGFDRVDDFTGAFNLGEIGDISVTTVDVSDATASGGIGGAPEWAGIDEAFLLVYQGRSRSPSVNYYRGPFRLWGSYEGDSGTPEDTWTLATGNPYPLIADMACRFRFRVTYPDGRLTPEVFAGALIQA